MKRVTYIVLMCLPAIWPGTILNAQFVDLLWERLAHYPFSGDAQDISGFENHGSVYGATLVEDYRGGTGNAYFFDGLDDYIDCGNGMVPLSSAVTVSCWIKAGPELDNSHIVSRYDFASDGGFILGTQDGLVRWAGRMGAGRFIKITSMTRIDDDRWHCLAGVVNGNRWSLYIDGVLENQLVTGDQESDLSTTASLTIGCYCGGESDDRQYFRGSVDNVLIYGRALNECELEFIFSGTPYGPR
jgi:hypothetical protein